MFKKLLGWFRKRSPEDAYTPKERLIFYYFDGEKVVWADPIALYKEVMKVGPNLGIALKLANSLSKDAMEGFAEAESHIRSIFKLKAPNGLDVRGTLTSTEAMRLFDRFMEYQENIKKNSRPSQTISMPSVDLAITSEANDQPTTNTSDSGSTASVSFTAEQVSLT